MCNKQLNSKNLKQNWRIEMKELITHNHTDTELMKYWDIDELRLHLIKTVIELDNDETIDDCLGMFESVIHLRKQCLNPPDTIQEKLLVINELIDGHGVEPIQVSEELYQDSYWGSVIGEYINLGDTYDLTIVYNVIELEWEVISWGDYFEAKEAELKAELDNESPY